MEMTLILKNVTNVNFFNFKERKNFKFKGRVRIRYWLYESGSASKWYGSETPDQLTDLIVFTSTAYTVP